MHFFTKTARLLFFCIALCNAPIKLHAMTWEQSPYLNTALLGNSEKTTQKLIADGFQEVRFTSEEDKISISGLLREAKTKPPKAQIVYCAGFYPGRMQGIATFFPMFKDLEESDDVTQLFFDARGHGKSEGPFFSNLGRYGMNEYKDIIGALRLLKEKNPDTPIILHGICAGSFHAARALIKLQENTTLKEYNIIGLVSDSGFASVMSMLDIPGKHIKRKVVPPYLRCINPSITALFACLKCVLRRSLDSQDQETKLLGKMNQISCPVLFIHTEDDDYVACEKIKALAQETPDAYTWWLQKGEGGHTVNHLKQKRAYQGIVAAFIQKCLQKRSAKKQSQPQSERPANAILASKTKTFTTKLGMALCYAKNFKWPQATQKPEYITTIPTPKQTYKSSQ